jgi:hypothetical protein
MIFVLYSKSSHVLISDLIQVTKGCFVKKRHVLKRQALKRATARRFGVSVSELEWVDGQLCWSTNLAPVTGVEQVHKPAPVENVATVDTVEMDCPAPHGWRFSLRW